MRCRALRFVCSASATYGPFSSLLISRHRSPMVALTSYVLNSGWVSLTSS